MVEKVEDLVDDGRAQAADAHPFTAEKVKICAHCGATNAADATRCGQCGASTDDARTTSTVAATCPHCAGDRPMVPEQDDHGDTGTGADVYHGNCPHCGQTAKSANEAKAALEKGQFPEWGQKSNKFYP